MARYNITSPDGKETITVEGPDDATPQELQKFAGQQFGGKYAKNPVEIRSPVQSGNDMLKNKPGYQDLLMQGASFGFADEIAGGVNALMNPMTTGAYAQGRDSVRARVDEARQNTGWTGTAAEIGGGLLGGIPRAGAGAILSIGQAIKRGVTTGAGLGALAGFGSGEGAVDSLIKSGVGAAGGAALGGALPVAANVIGSRVAGMRRLMGSDTGGLARQLVGESIAADASTPALVGARLSQAADRGTPLAIADTGENARGLLASVARRPGGARTIAREAIGTRQAEQSDRVVGAIGRDLGPVGYVPQVSDDITEAGRRIAKPLYEEAYASPIEMTPQLAQILETPAGKQGLNKSMTIAKNEGRDPTALGFDTTEDGEAILTSVPTLETLDLVKRGLDDLVEDFRDPVTRRLNLNSMGRSIDDVRKGLIGEADRQVPVYGQARAAFAGQAGQRDALELGKASLNASADDIGRATTPLNEAEKQQFALGFRSAMAENLGRATDGASVAQRMLGTPRKREALKKLFGGSDEFSRFLATMNDERATTETYRSVMTGSQTAERMAADAQTGDAGLVESAVGAGLRGVTQPVGLLGDALKALRDVGQFGAGRAGDQTRESVAALLTESDPAMLTELARTIKRAQVRQKALSRGVNRTTGKLGATIGNEFGLATGALNTQDR